jgi:hypothetical protein
MPLTPDGTDVHAWVRKTFCNIGRSHDFIANQCQVFPFQGKRLSDGRHWKVSDKNWLSLPSTLPSLLSSLLFFSISVLHFSFDFPLLSPPLLSPPLPSPPLTSLRTKFRNSQTLSLLAKSYHKEIPPKSDQHLPVRWL